VLQDQYIGKLGCYPAAQKATPDILDAYTEFAAGKQILEVRSDCRPELALANKEGRIKADTSTPYRPSFNSDAESDVRLRFA
jgi:hypothetical protein